MSDYSIKIGNMDFWYEGSKSDCARWFCIVTNSKLFIKPVSNNEPERLGLFVEFANSGRMQDILYFENDTGAYLPSLEEAYELFFDEYILDTKNSDFDYELREID